MCSRDLLRYCVTWKDSEERFRKLLKSKVGIASCLGGGAVAVFVVVVVAVLTVNPVSAQYSSSMYPSWSN